MTKKVVVNDSMQRGYTYERTVPEGKKFDPEFKPELTPREMLEIGVFNGVYMRDCVSEFPKSWFTHAKFAKAGPDKSINFFGVTASQPLSEWKRKGWLSKEDPRGWFQWYCRYYMGRRLEKEDARQIGRWKAFRRHLAQVSYNCSPKDLLCRRKQRQAILHWAYDSRKI